MKAKKDIFYFFIKISLKTLFFISIIKLSSLFKLSFIFGSKFATFSGTSFSVPIAGAFGGGFVSFIIFSLLLLIRYFIFGVSSFHILAFYLPGLCAALYFSYKNIFTRLLLPVLCIILFILHPVGIKAFLYSFFWIIPIVIYFLKSKNIFLESLASTFIAHAVGSVIFLYTLELSPVFFNSLIPLVIFERLAIASAIYVLYKLFNYLKSKIFATNLLMENLDDQAYRIYYGWQQKMGNKAGDV